MTLDLYQRLTRDLRAAIAERDPAAVATLRTAISAIDNARSVETDDTGYRVGRSVDVPRRELDEAAMRQVIESEIEERHQAIAELADLGQDQHVSRLQEEVARLEVYLDPV